MSFTSTYTNLSIRGWSSNQQLYQQVDIELNANVGDSVTISLNGNKVAASNLSSDTIKIYNLINNQLTLANTIVGNFAIPTNFGPVDFDQNGNYLVIGAADAVQGNARIYLNGAFEQQITNASATNFGYDVAINNDGNLVIIGTFVDNTAWIFERTSNIWNLLTSVTQSSVRLGASVDINGSGNVIVAGAPLYDGANTDQGAAYIYFRSGNTYNLNTTVTASDGANGDSFGTSVAISADGNYVLVGAPNHDANGFNNTGAAYIFKYDGNTYNQIEKLLPFPTLANGIRMGGQPDQMSISNDGQYIAVGAQESNLEGAIYTFIGNGNSYTAFQKITNNPQANNQYFGYTNAMNGDGSLIITSYGNNSPSGNLVLLGK